MPRAKTPEETHCEKISISFTQEDYKRIIAYCQKEERSIAWVVRKALKDWFEKQGL